MKKNSCSNVKTKESLYFNDALQYGIYLIKSFPLLEIKKSSITKKYN